VTGQGDESHGDMYVGTLTDSTMIRETMQELMEYQSRMETCILQGVSAGHIWWD
jgi:hypothetical protein